ncbi:hypothetical protein CPAV1605_692 [seawater metagenome]|uniref:Uncharacterized protein n=1 Tax=seawater metagenome TaxID=1561972 RepID=A0A5E8CIQ7_9ZZZZ
MSLDEINKNFPLIFIIVIVLTWNYLSKFMPSELNNFLNKIPIRIACIGLIFYISKKNFNIALVLTVIYFLSTQSNNIENMANDDTVPNCKFRPLGLSKYCSATNQGSWFDKALCATVPNSDKCTQYCKIYTDPFNKGIDTCKMKCENLKTKNDCSNSNNPQCDWVDGTCVTDCNWADTTKCTENKYCKLNNDNSKCMTNCDTVDIPLDICKKGYNCSVNNNKCKIKCGVYLDKQSCDNNSGCNWDTTDGICK